MENNNKKEQKAEVKAAKKEYKIKKKNSKRKL